MCGRVRGSLHGPPESHGRSDPLKLRLGSQVFAFFSFGLCWGLHLNLTRFKLSLSCLSPHCEQREDGEETQLSMSVFPPQEAAFTHAPNTQRGKQEPYDLLCVLPFHM